MFSSDDQEFLLSSYSADLEAVLHRFCKGQQFQIFQKFWRKNFRDRINTSQSYKVLTFRPVIFLIISERCIREFYFRWESGM